MITLRPDTVVALDFDSKKTFAFSVFDPASKRTYHMVTTDADSREGWMEALKDVIKNLDANAGAATGAGAGAGAGAGGARKQGDESD